VRPSLWELRSKVLMKFLKRFSPLFWYTIGLGAAFSSVHLFLMTRLLRELSAEAALGALTNKQEYLLKGHVWSYNFTTAALAMQPHVLALSSVQWLLIVVSALYALGCIACFRMGYVVGCRFLTKVNTLP
jgi:hypothetical protein